MALTTEWVEVDPDTAASWLDSMGRNRRLSESNLDSIIMAMREGRWHEDGDPIRFNKEGELIDGQHRMHAIIATNLTHRFLVLWGVEETAMTTLNTGKSRSRSDVLTIHDPEAKDVVALSSAGTIALRWEKGARGNSLRNMVVSNDEFMQFYDDNKDRIIHAKNAGRRVASASRGVTLQAIALCDYLFRALDAEDAEFFWDRVIDGVNLQEGSPILTLRRFFESESKLQARDNSRADIAAAYTIKAWNAYREGRDLKLLKFRVGGAKPEAFPEPV